jgi:hypothetical protein
MQVARGGLEIRVPRQLLDGADVHAVADEVSGAGRGVWFNVKCTGAVWFDALAQVPQL